MLSSFFEFCNDLLDDAIAENLLEQCVVSRRAIGHPSTIPADSIPAIVALIDTYGYTNVCRCVVVEVLV